MSRINATTASLPGTPWAAACRAIREGIHEPLWGILDSKHVQLCPQNSGYMGYDVLDACREQLPTTQFRLHASVKIDRDRHQIVDGSTAGEYAEEYIWKIAALSKDLGTEDYTLHAGRRENSTLGDMRDRVLRWQDETGLRIGVEGLYPVKNRPKMWLIDSWDEYEWLYDSGLHYAIDLSHLNIVAEYWGCKLPAFTKALIMSPYCIEVHVSGNDGTRDSHGIITEEPWWMKPLESAIANGMTAVIFSEANQKGAMQ